MIDLDIVNGRLVVGSRPESREDLEQLRQLGITGVLNLQTNSDLRQLGVNWAVLWRIHVELKLEIQRFEIRDFNPLDLMEKLNEAVEILESLSLRHERIYVHCTAGVNRSPTVAIAWLALKQHYSVEEAIQQVMSRRTCAQPYPQVLKWLKKEEARALRATRS